MRRIKLIAITVLLIVIALTIAFFTLNYTKEGEALIATGFVKNEATYRFDGISETFKLKETVPLQCPYCWEFQFEYQCKNSGYGDRRDVVLNPIVTYHTARIVMEKGIIKSATLDNEWDMKNQRLI